MKKQLVEMKEKLQLFVSANFNETSSAQLEAVLTDIEVLSLEMENLESDAEEAANSAET